MAKMLRHTETGEIYPYNPSLALHEKMEDYESVPEDFKQEKPARRGRTATKRKTKAEKEAEAAAAAEAAEKAAQEEAAAAGAVVDGETVTASDAVETDDDLSGLEGLDDLDED